ETFIHEAKVILWKKSKGKEVAALHQKNFLKINIVYGDVDKDKKVKNKEVLEAMDESDLLIHGSGPSVVGQVNLEAWHLHHNKPFGIFGVTIQEINLELKKLLQKSSFIYARETKSLDVLKKAGV